MKKILILSMISASLQIQAQVSSQNQIAKQAPKTQKGSETDNYFGKKITDSYRWLEDDNSAVTNAWVKMQNQYTESFLSTIPFRAKMHQELEKMWNYEKFSAPFKEGNYHLFYKNDGLQNQSVLYIQGNQNSTPVEFLNPNKFNEKGTSALNSVSFSKNQKYCAYSVSNAGSDWQDIYVMDVNTKKLLTDVIRYSKFSGISWKGEEGFYYSGYDKPQNESEKYSAKTEYQKIFFHKMGTDQKEDMIIYEDKQHPLLYKGVTLSEDERWLILSISEGTDGTDLYYMDLKKDDKKFHLIGKEGFKTNQDFIDVVDEKLLLYTNNNASNYQLILFDPETKQQSVFVAEKSSKLDAASRVGDKIFCNYLVNASSKIEIYNLKGSLIDSLKQPGIGTISGFYGKSTDQQTFYTFTSFNSPSTIYQYDIATGKSSIFKSTKLNIEMQPTVVEQIWFESKDGTMVPMFVYHRKDIDIHSGRPLPVFLYGYGGFNISITPSFSVPISYFVQKGGVYVSVSLRGGSEFGEAWHQQGMLSNKQTVFDDFIGAAEYLIKNKITTSEQLAIHGRSNGGLLVGACMTQRPDLYKVALPGVGVLDMLRYHKFTVGWGWAVEYGSSDNEKDFNYLIKYSPLHNVKKGTQYPATMITTADHDDRVVPAHSFKFAAALQEAQTGNNPILIRIDVQAGHGAGKPTSKQIDEWTDIFSFVMNELKMKF